MGTLKRGRSAKQTGRASLGPFFLRGSEKATQDWPAQPVQAGREESSPYVRKFANVANGRNRCWNDALHCLGAQRTKVTGDPPCGRSRAGGASVLTERLGGTILRNRANLRCKIHTH
jgi:hypothetical protein